MMVSAARQAVRSIDRDLVPTDVMTLDDVVYDARTALL